MERDSYVRPVRPNQARTVTDHTRDKVERLLFCIPIFTLTAVGLIFMGSRFILVLRDNLKQNPDSLAAMMFLAILVGSVSLIIVLACGFIGAVIGSILSACFAKPRRMGLRCAPKHTSVL